MRTTQHHLFMSTKSLPDKRKWPVKRTIVISIIGMLLVAALVLYANINRLLANALLNSYESTLVADVYELKFDELQVNIISGTIGVYNVTFQPREKPLADYPYINSRFTLKTKKLRLENVDIPTLLSYNRLELDKVLINNPDVEMVLNGKRHIILPFNDSTTVKPAGEGKKKNPLKSFSLSEFQLIDASMHVINNYKKRDFVVGKFNISLYDLLVSQKLGQYDASFSKVNLGIGQFNGTMQREAISSVKFSDFNVGLDSLSMQFTLDTLISKFHDFHTGMRQLDVQTKDSVFQMSMQSFELSYLKKDIHLKKVSFNPNVSHAEIQKEYKYQHTEFSGNVGAIHINGIAFDSLVYGKKVLIDELVLDSIQAYIYKDNTKPLDKGKMPVYLGQTIAKIPIPVVVGHIKASNVWLENTERKPDGNLAKVTIARANAEINSFTNRGSDEGLALKADGYILDKVFFKAGMVFDYAKPQFTYHGVVGTFQLPDLNPLIQAYTPARILTGVADEISFDGVAKEKTASGTLKFLYHDLKVDLQIKDKAKWKSSVVSFTANTAMNSNNPLTENHPPRVVGFEVERNMNKGFVNIVIKSILDGLKETMVMSKENRQQYQQAKKELQKGDK
jgi:hypothetical protein